MHVDSQHPCPSSPPLPPSLWNTRPLSLPVPFRVATSKKPPLHTHRHSIASTSSFASLPLYQDDRRGSEGSARLSLTISKPPAYDFVVVAGGIGEEELGAAEGACEGEDLGRPVEEDEAGETTEAEMVEPDEGEGEAYDQLDLLILKSTALLEVSQAVLASTLESRQQFARFFSLEDSLSHSLFEHERSLRGTLDVADDLETATERVRRSVETFADGRTESVATRKRVEPAQPKDPRSLLRTATPRRSHPPRISTMYLSSNETTLPTLDQPPSSPTPTPLLPAPQISDPSPPLPAEPPPESGSLLISSWRTGTGALAGVLGDLGRGDPPPSPRPSASSLLNALAASTPSRSRHSSSTSLSLPPSPSPSLSPSIFLTTPKRRTSPSPTLSPSSHPTSFATSLFSSVPENDDDAVAPTTPTTSRTPSPSRSRSPSPTTPRNSCPSSPSRPRHLRSRGSFSPLPPALFLATPPASTFPLSVANSPSTPGFSYSISSTPASIFAPTSSLSTPNGPTLSSGEDLVRVKAVGDVGHRRSESGLRERLEAMKKAQAPAVASVSEAKAGEEGGASWWGWRG